MSKSLLIEALFNASNKPFVPVNEAYAPPTAPTVIVAGNGAAVLNKLPNVFIGKLAAVKATELGVVLNVVNLFEAIFGVAAKSCAITKYSIESPCT